MNSEWIEKLRAAAAMCQSQDDELDYKYWAAVAFDMLPKASACITELEAQVAALQEIAISERERRHISDMSRFGFVLDSDASPDPRKLAADQLAEEHPEAFL